MTTGTPQADGPVPQDPPDGDHPTFDTSVAHVARIYDYWLGGKDNYAVDRAAGDAALKAYPDLIHSVRSNRAFMKRAVRYLALSQIASDIDADEVAQARDQVGRYMPVKQTYRTHAQVMRFFGGLELAEPGLVRVTEWRPGSPAEAAMPTALWGGVARKP